MNWDWYNSIIMKYQKIAEATSDLIGNKITKVLQNSQQNNSETVTKNMIKKYVKKDISTEERQKIIDNLWWNMIA